MLHSGPLNPILQNVASVAEIAETQTAFLGINILIYYMVLPFFWKYSVVAGSTLLFMLSKKKKINKEEFLNLNGALIYISTYRCRVLTGAEDRSTQKGAAAVKSPFTVPQVKMQAHQQNAATRRRTRNSKTFTFCGSGACTWKDSGRFHQQTMINSHGRERAGPNCCHTQRKSTRGADAHTNEAKLVVMKPLFLFSSLTVYVKLLFVK